MKNKHKSEYGYDCTAVEHAHTGEDDRFTCIVKQFTCEQKKIRTFYFIKILRVEMIRSKEKGALKESSLAKTL